MSRNPSDIHREFLEAGGPPPASTFLLSDGRGGAAQLTLGGYPAREWHAAYLPGAGFGTTLRWASPGLGLEWAGRKIWLPEDPAEFSALPPDVLLESFDEDPFPRWRYRVGESRLEAMLACRHGEPAVVLRVHVFGARPGMRLLFRPAFSVAPPAPGEVALQPLALFAGETPHSRSVHGHGEDAHLEVLHPEAETVRGPGWDHAPRVSGHWFRPATLALALPFGESVRDFRVSVSGVKFLEAGEVVEAGVRRLGELRGPSAAEASGGELLTRSLDRFVGRDAGGECRLFPWLPGREAPGLRDSMRALPHALLGFERFHESREILAGAAHQVHAVLLPEGSAVATDEALGPALLHWILAGYRHAQIADDFDYLRAEQWPVWMELIETIESGALAALRFRRGPLLLAPEVQGRADLPAHLELNALWHSALRVMAESAARIGKSELRADFESKSRSVRHAIREALYDPWRESFVEPGAPDARPQVNATALKALELPFRLLDLERERRLLLRVRERLWHPRGIRLVEPGGEGSAGDEAHEALVPALLGAWARAEWRLGPLGGPTSQAMVRSRDAAGPRLLEGLLGHACPVLDARPPFGPHPQANPEELERAHLETDAETLALFLPQAHLQRPARETQV